MSLEQIEINKKDRAEKRKALIAAQRHGQHVRRKARIVQHYKDSIIELRELNKELRDCTAVLRGARTSYSDTLSAAQRSSLDYARGFNDGREMGRKEGI